MKKCIVCSQGKGRRICKLHNREPICSLCCAKSRNLDCEGCLHYASAKQYAISKSKESKTKHFIAEINPEVEDTVNEGLRLVEKGDIEKGEAIISNLIKGHPRSHVVYYGLGVVHAFKKQHDEAIKYFDRAIDIFPYFVEAHYNKAIAYKEKLQIANTIKSFKEVVAIGDPEDEIVKDARDFLRKIEQQVKKTDGIDLEIYAECQEKFDKAISYMEKQEWAKALDGFKDVLNKHKRHTQSYGNMGICYFRLGEREQALAALDKALEIDPAYEPAIINRIAFGYSEEDKNNRQSELKSINYYKDYGAKKGSLVQSFLQIDDSEPNQICQEAQKYFQREDFGRAAHMLAGALKKNPQDIQLQLNYAAALSMLGYLDYAWKVSCYIAAQLINAESHPLEEKFFDNMSALFFTIAHSDRGEKEITIEEKTRPLIRHRGLPPPDYRVIFPFSEQKISLCMITRNEENCIAKALASVKDYVDEIVLVDTGSTDRTCQIAASYGARIYHHPWNNDFSESRNYSMGYVTGDWILVLDADETINYLDLIYLKELAAQKEQHAYSFQQRSYTNERNTLGLIENDEWYNESVGYAGWLENIICRFFRRNSQVYYKRPVHEALEYRLKELGILPLILQMPIHHYGKLSPSEIRNKKSQQYIDINKRYLERVTDREDLICGNYQIGQSLAAMGKPEEAVVYLEEAVRLINQGKPFRGNDSQGGPVVVLASLYVTLNRPLDALKHLKRQIEMDPENDNYWLTLAQVHLHLKDFRAFSQSLDKCLSLNPKNEKASTMKDKYMRDEKISGLAAELEKYTEIDKAVEELQKNHNHIYEEMSKDIDTFNRLGFNLFRREEFSHFYFDIETIKSCFEKIGYPPLVKLGEERMGRYIRDCVLYIANGEVREKLSRELMRMLSPFVRERHYQDAWVIYLTAVATTEHKDSPNPFLSQMVLNGLMKWEKIKEDKFQGILKKIGIDLNAISGKQCSYELENLFSGKMRGHGAEKIFEEFYRLHPDLHGAAQAQTHEMVMESLKLIEEGKMEHLLFSPLEVADATDEICSKLQIIETNLNSGKISFGEKEMEKRCGDIFLQTSRKSLKRLLTEERKKGMGNRLKDYRQKLMQEGKKEDVAYVYAAEMSLNSLSDENNPFLLGLMMESLRQALSEKAKK